MFHDADVDDEGLDGNAVDAVDSPVAALADVDGVDAIAGHRAAVIADFGMANTAGGGHHAAARCD